jgi:hypothetical protein
MRVLGLTVGRNESHRYLLSMLDAATRVLDRRFFYDDRSTDDTVDMAREFADVVVRPEHAASFSQDEGMFREGAWRAFEEVMHPELGDWILVIDCDEQLVGTPSARQALLATIEGAGNQPVDLDIPEVFGWDLDGNPLVRLDGFWGTIHAPRLFPYRGGEIFSHGKVGVPAIPAWVMGGQWAHPAVDSELFLMHFGYAEEADHFAKYTRYVGVSGHADSHVQSIMAPDKTLVPWIGPPPRGMVYGYR